MSSLKDVAKLAGVSVATVSRVINNSPLVLPETTATVREAIRKLDYRPNLLAQGLRGNSGSLFGLIVRESRHYYFARLIQGISDYCYENNYNLLIGSHHDDPTIEEKLVDSFCRRNVNGIIISLVSDESRVSTKLGTLGIPSVVIDRAINNVLCPSIVLDNYKAGYIAGKHLVELGHRRIACISGPTSIRLSRERIAGFKSVMAESGIMMYENWLIESEFQYDPGIEAAKRLFSDKTNYPTAVWAQNDLIAAAVINYLADIGMRVPEDVSVVGMDNIDLSRIIRPALTTISQPFDEISHNAVDLLLTLQSSYDSSAPKTPPTSTVVQPLLVMRQSTAPYIAK